MNSLDRDVVKQVQSVFVGADELISVNKQVQLKVEPGDMRIRVDERALEAFEPRRLHGKIVQPEHHLADRRMVERARGVDRFDDHVEGQIAVVDRFDRRAADLRQVIRKTRISRDAQPQRKAC